MIFSCIDNNDELLTWPDGAAFQSSVLYKLYLWSN